MPNFSHWKLQSVSMPALVWQSLVMGCGCLSIHICHIGSTYILYICLSFCYLFFIITHVIKDVYIVVFSLDSMLIDMVCYLFMLIVRFNSFAEELMLFLGSINISIFMLQLRNQNKVNIQFSIHTKAFLQCKQNSLQTN